MEVDEIHFLNSKEKIHMNYPTVLCGYAFLDKKGGEQAT
jgi:hypothetical protein